MSTNRISRRDLLKGLGITAAGSVLAACAPEVIRETVTVKETVMVEGTPEVVEVEKVVTVEVEAPSDEPITIRWWSYYAPSGRALLCAGIAKEFEDLNPGVTVELGHGLAAYTEKLATAYSAGDPPELHGATHTTMLLEIQDDALMGLQDWYDQSGALDTVHPGAQAWCTVDGKLYAVSGWDLFVQEWYYNKRVFDELGLSEPTTEEAVAETVKALEDRVSYPFAFPGGQSWAWTCFLSTVQAQTCGITLIEQGTMAKDYHIPELQEAIEITERMFSDKVVSPDSLGLTADDMKALFAQAEIGFTNIFHTGWLPGLQAAVQEAGDKTQLAYFDSAVLYTDNPLSPWPAGYGMVNAVPKQNQQVGATFDLMTYIWSPEVQRRIAEAGVGVPPLPEVWDSVTDPLYQGTIKHLGEATAESLYLIDFIHPQVIEALYVSMLDMAKGEGTAVGVLDAMTDAIKAV